MDTEINLEENAIRYYLMPLLQHISAVKIVTALWRQSEIQHHVAKLLNKTGYDVDFKCKIVPEIWIKIGDKVLDGVSQLPVPNRIRKILSNIVDPIGLEIYDWTINHEKYLFSDDHPGHLYQKPITTNYMNHLVWTSRGRLDYQGTAQRLLDARQLSDNDQYNIACTYCLEDEIAIIAPKVIDSLFLESLAEHGMLYFWTSHMTGDFTELDKAVNCYNTENRTDRSANECIFDEVMDIVTNQVAVKYIWDKLSQEERSRQIDAAITQISNDDFKCYILSQMSRDQQEEVFKTCSCNVLLSLLDDWLWREYFLPTFNKIKHVISEAHYLIVLEAIVAKMDEIHRDIAKYNHYRAIFKEFWQCAPKHLKEYVIEYNDGKRGHRIFFRLFSERNADIIQSILFDCNYTQKKNIIFSVGSMDKCDFLISSNQWDLLEMFIEHTLVSEDDVNHFKQKLVKARGHFIAEHFIANKEWNKVVEFEKWALKSDDERKEFRERSTHSWIFIDTLQSIVENNKGDFAEFERVFKWCASGDDESVMRLKAKMSQVHFVVVLICKLIEENKYEFLEQMLNWCFAHDPKQIDQFKQSFYDHKCCERFWLVCHLIKQDDGLQSFTSFVHWCFSGEQEINKFKDSLLHPGPDALTVCMKLLYESQFKLADEFVNWLCNSSHILIHNFKNSLVLSRDMDKLYDERSDLLYDESDYLQQLHEYATETFKWFNPSTETVVKFREQFTYFEWFEDILPALNNYVQGQKHF